ncbi:cation diffusion facilitator family transporter [Candidatus Viridilinea mediisalina]|uniref:Cation-efflux pump n=1 Tax=Candidatus Viridilinea mediisalina TaxID=2024553 RepID=A0A2A6RKH5_9CHLR|nr:cation diffusion facilitator family transporter [Candidatus Viridilinea mediisalina]PDW03577.1 cation-efflux pump [Candidatus Viridilinea mediisalina]
MHTSRASLTRFAWLAIVAAIVTIGLKFGAYLITGSVGLLSDALESLTNLVAAIVALIALTIAARPPDEDHAYGHGKAEYFASGVEGGLILLAAVSIIYTAADRLITPQPIEQVGLGLVIVVVASLINLVVARILLQAGREYQSVTLEADAQHLFTDVWTSVGVVVGVAAVALTGWERLDPIIAMVVAANIIWSGVRLIRNSALGLLDTALPTAELAQVEAILTSFQMREGVQYHALRTRQAAARRFVSVHILVPGAWSVTRGHQLLEEIEAEVRSALPNTTMLTHLEPLEDPRSFEDQQLDRV